MRTGDGSSVDEKKRRKINFIGFDQRHAYRILKDGTIRGVVVQDPYRMVMMRPTTCPSASRGKRFRRNVSTGANLITKEETWPKPRQHALCSPSEVVLW